MLPVIIEEQLDPVYVAGMMTAMMESSSSRPEHQNASNAEGYGGLGEKYGEVMNR